MRRSGLIRKGARADRRSGANRSPRSVQSVLVVSGQGKPTRYLDITGWRVAILAFFLLNGLAISFLLGLFLHDVTAPHQNLWLLQHTRPSPGTHPTFLSKFTSTAKTMSKKETEQKIRASILAKRLGLGTRAVAGKLLAGQPEPQWLEAAGKGWHIPKTLMWPVPEGWYVRGFGSGEAGYHLAVDIMGETGTAVRAAAPGIVGYSNNDVRGYGNMVILIHPGGWITAYAHNSSNLVNVGERVGTGRTLALLGSTGISRGPHVHFEFIFGGKMCNPSPLFRPGVRHRYGNEFPIKQVVWNPLGERPKEVACKRRRRHPRSYYYDLHPERSPYRNDEELETEEETEEATSEETRDLEAASIDQTSEEKKSKKRLPSEKSSEEKAPAPETPKSRDEVKQEPPEKKPGMKKISSDQIPEVAAAKTPLLESKQIEEPSDEQSTENKSYEEAIEKSTASGKEKPVVNAPSEETPRNEPLKDKGSSDRSSVEETSAE